MAIDRTALPIKRKPLPRDSQHVVPLLQQSSEHAVTSPLSIEDDLPWSLPPLTNFGSFDADHGASEESSALSEAGGLLRDPEIRCSSQIHQATPVPVPAEHHSALLAQKAPVLSENAIAEESRVSSTAQLWNPAWLHRLTLLAFVLVFCSLLVGLVLLSHFAAQNNGIETDITQNHYAWTYGPTALLIMVATAWGQVDFYSRALTPWSHLRRGPVSAENSILLDYVSPILPKILTTAASKRDWAVLASGLGALLLRLVTVFSTGLLVLTPTEVSKLQPHAIVNSTFSAAGYSGNPTAIETELMRYLDIEKQESTYQYGASETAAYETIDLDSVVPNSTVTATVQGVFPFFDCEVVTPKLEGSNMTWNSGCGPLSATYTTICTLPNCTPGRTIISTDTWKFPNTSDHQQWNDLNPCLNFYQLAVIDVFVEREAGQSVKTSAGWNITLTDTVGLFCAAGYSVDKVRLTVDTSDPASGNGISTTGPLDRVAEIIPGFPYASLTKALENELLLTGLPDLKTTPNSYIDSGFPLLLADLNGGSASILLNANALKSTAEKAFKGIAVQLIHKYLRKPHNTTVAAELVVQQQRLQIRAVSVWAMNTGFVLLALCAVVILAWRPKNVVPRDPISIAGQACVLAASPQLQVSLEKAGSFAPSLTAERLRGLETVSCITNTRGEVQFHIETRANDMSKVGLAIRFDKFSWWHPQSASPWFASIALVLPLTIIVLLEVLQHESDKHHGLANVSATSTVVHSLPSLLASAIVLSIAMVYDALYFAAATLAPFQLLARRTAAATERDINTSLGNLPIWSTIKAVRQRHTAAAIASVAALIGSLLTIISSGLYTFDSVPYAPSIGVTVSDRFVPSFGISTDGSASFNLQSIEQNNGSYPPLTYDGLAFPNLNLSKLDINSSNQLGDVGQVTLQANIKATRASLKCEMVPNSIMKIDTYAPEDSRGCLNTAVNFNAGLPPSCPHFLNAHNQTASQIPLEFDLQLSCPGSPVLTVHHQAVLTNQRYELNYELNIAFFAGSPLGAPNNPPECPSLAFLSGYFVENSTSTENFTAMTCIQGLEEVDAMTTFDLSTGSLLIKSEPVVDESSAKWLQSFNSVYWFTSGTFAELLQPTISYAGVFSDNFYSQVNYGPEGIPPSELTGPANAQRFVNSTQQMYRRYMAQLISGTMREKLTATGEVAAPQYSGVIQGMSHLRLQQNTTSKLILQVFLAVMLLCGLFVYSRRDLGRVIPMCPWSIAGTMSLLAGSDMLDRKVIPLGAGSLKDPELAKALAGHIFSLGWWDNAKAAQIGPFPVEGLVLV